MTNELRVSQHHPIKAWGEASSTAPISTKQKNAQVYPEGFSSRSKEESITEKVDRQRLKTPPLPSATLSLATDKSVETVKANTPPGFLVSAKPSSLISDKPLASPTRIYNLKQIEALNPDQLKLQIETILKCKFEHFNPQKFAMFMLSEQISDGQKQDLILLLTVLGHLELIQITLQFQNNKYFTPKFRGEILEAVLKVRGSPELLLPTVEKLMPPPNRREIAIDAKDAKNDWIDTTSICNALELIITNPMNVDGDLCLVFFQCLSANVALTDTMLGEALILAAEREQPFIFNHILTMGKEIAPDFLSEAIQIAKAKPSIHFRIPIELDQKLGQVEESFIMPGTSQKARPIPHQVPKLGKRKEMGATIPKQPEIVGTHAGAPSQLKKSHSIEDLSKGCTKKSKNKSHCVIL